MIFETHAHYNDTAFDADRDSLLSKMQEGGIETIVNIAVDPPSVRESLALAEKYPFIYAAVGYHPSDIVRMAGMNEPENYSNHEDVQSSTSAEKTAESVSLTEPQEFWTDGRFDLDAALSWLSKMADHEKAIAIGEIGLDYYWCRKKEQREFQREVFRRQIAIAREKKLPIVIHSRDAAKHTLEIAKEEKLGEVGGVVHCYGYSVEHAREYVKMGMYLGIGGVVTFKNSRVLKEVVTEIPIEHLVLETDSPYLSPEPFRGKRNTSLKLPYVVEKIAELKGISPEKVEKVTWENARRMYRL